MPSLASLRAFELVARHGNFAAAARALNVTHAAIAQRVRALEAELGVSLTRRSGRSITLTAAGAQLARSLADGFETIADSVDAVRLLEAHRPVQVSATIFIAQTVVLPKLHAFWAAHPEIQVSLIPTQDIVDIAALGFDLAIRASSAEPGWPELDAEFLLESEIIAVGAPSIVHDDMPPIDQVPWFWAWDEKHEEDAVRAFGVDTDKIRKFNVTPMLSVKAACSGLGVTFSTEIIVRNELDSGLLRRVPVPSPFSVRYYVATPKGPIRPQATAFIGWLKDIVAEENNASPSATG